MTKIKLLMVDNYDSFTFNIVQYFGELGAEVEVFRNDEITLEGIAARQPDRLVISRRSRMHSWATRPCSLVYSTGNFSPSDLAM